MVGEFGEVWVMNWGLSKILDRGVELSGTDSVLHYTVPFDCAIRSWSEEWGTLVVTQG